MTIHVPDRYFIKRLPRLSSAYVTVALLAAASFTSCTRQTSTVGSPGQVQTSSCLPQRYPLEEARARANVLQLTCKRLGVTDTETERADTLLSILDTRKNRQPGQVLMRLDYASTLYELALAHDQIQRHERSLARLEEQLKVFQEIVDDLETIGRR